uniref:Intraflagellar transport protein 56 n=1 Tax=Hucho hucho TaxID=62062 RepID=A0A4W5RPG6_9TELE
MTILSRVKPAVGGDSAASVSEKNKKNKAKKSPRLEEYLNQRDYLGAQTLLEHPGVASSLLTLRLVFCGYYLMKLPEYRALTLRLEEPREVWVYLACTQFFLGLYREAEEAANKGEQTNHAFPLCSQFNDEKKLMGFHQNLEDVTENQLSLASIHYMRSHYQENRYLYWAILPYFLALNVYVALCYYKLDYYDVSQEVLAVYLQSIPESTIGLNLKACNHFRLYNGKAAEAELKNLIDISSCSFEFAKELIRHNLVSRGVSLWGGVLQVLPLLIDVISEARLNLVIYYLRQDDVQEAYTLIKDLEPTTPQVAIDSHYQCCLSSHSDIMNQKGRLAWELYLKMGASPDSFSLLQLIMGQFYWAAKAFDSLEKLDPDSNYWEGKRGACVGIFQFILAGREPKETLKEVLPLLRSTQNPQVEYIIRALRQWAKDNRVPLTYQCHNVLNSHNTLITCCYYIICVVHMCIFYQTLLLVKINQITCSHESCTMCIDELYCTYVTVFISCTTCVLFAMYIILYNLANQLY